MAKKPTKRTYPFSDGTLTQTSDDIIAFGTRDLADLAGFGYTALEIGAIQTIRDTFFGFPVDEFYSGEISVATAAKNAAVAAMANRAEDIVMIASRTYGDGSSTMSLFGFAGFGKRRDPDKLMVCKSIHKVATDRLVELTAKGLTQQILDDYDDEIKAADRAFTTKNLKVSERDSKTQERIETGNSLYAKIVELCKVGKHVYEDTNEAKYNDYVINESTAPNPQFANGTPAPNAIHIPTIVVDDTADQIEFKNTGTTDMEVYFATEVTDAPNPAEVTVVLAGAQASNTAGVMGWTAAKPNLLIFNKNMTDAGAFELKVS